MFLFVSCLFFVAAAVTAVVAAAVVVVAAVAAAVARTLQPMPQQHFQCISSLWVVALAGLLVH